MRAWIRDAYSEDEGQDAIEGKSIIITATRAEVRAMASFMAAAAEHLERADSCHVHLRDHMPGWAKGDQRMTCHCVCRPPM